MQKDIFIVTGNKGGCGKTPISVLLIDYLLRSSISMNEIALVDGESAEKQATLTRILQASFPEDKSYGIELSSEQGYENLISLVIEKNCRYCVADSGAGLMGELERNLNFLNSFNNNEFQIVPHIIFVVGPSKESSAAARSFLMSNKDIKIKTDFILLAPPVENLRNLTSNDFDFSRSNDIVEFAKKLNFKTYFIPTIRQDFFDLILNEGKLPVIAINDKEILNVASKIRLSLFLNNYIDPVMSSIIGLNEDKDENE